MVRVSAALVAATSDGVLVAERKAEIFFSPPPPLPTAPSAQWNLHHQTVACTALYKVDATLRKRESRPASQCYAQTQGLHFVAGVSIAATTSLVHPIHLVFIIIVIVIDILIVIVVFS